MQIAALTWIIGSFIMIINTYFLISSFTKLLIHSEQNTVTKVFAGIFGFLGLLIYVVAVLYLTLRKNRKSMQPLLQQSTDAELASVGNPDLPAEAANGTLYHLPREDITSMQLPDGRPDRDPVLH
jgi:natural resistance-associated macrophage protein 2